MVDTKDYLFQVHVYLRKSHLRKIEKFKDLFYNQTRMKMSNSEAIRFIIDYFYQVLTEKETEKSKDNVVDKEYVN